MNSEAVGYYTVIHSAVRFLGLCCSLGCYCKNCRRLGDSNIRCSSLNLLEAREPKEPEEGALSGFQ